MSHQLKQVSCRLLGAGVVRSASVSFRVWPTHLLVLSGQEIQMLIKGLGILCLLHQVLNVSCKQEVLRVGMSWGHHVASRFTLASP